MLWERCSPDAPAEGPWPWALRAGTPVVRPTIVPGARFTCSRHRSVDVIIMSGLMPVDDDAASVLVWTEPFAYRWSVWSRHPVGPWRGCRTPSRA